jgi:hypothetical protein
LDKDDIVENVAATPLDKIAPTNDLPLSSDNLYGTTRILVKGKKSKINIIIQFSLFAS